LGASIVTRPQNKGVQTMAKDFYHTGLQVGRSDIASLLSAKAPGDVYYVDSVNGAINNSGKTKATAVITIDAAINLCTANKGDIIYVMPNHTEAIITAGAIDADVAGISIIGLGSGDNMPRVDYTAAAGSFVIGANNVTVENINFHANVTSVVVGVDIDAGVDFATIRGCRFDVETTATDEFLITIQTNDDSNFATVENCDIDNGLGGSVHAIKFTADTDGTKVIGNTIQGDYSTANIGGITTLSTKLVIANNLLINGGTGALGTEPVIELLTGSTGVIQNNNVVCNLATKAASIVADTCMLFENYYNEDVSSAGTGGIIGTASADD